MESHVKTKENQAEVLINSKIYPLECVYSAAYVFIDSAYIILDEDTSGYIKVIMRPKEDADPKNLGEEFYNELLAYADYQKRSEESKKVREVLLQRALITNDPGLVQERLQGENTEGLSDDEFDKLLNNLQEEVDESDDIAVPWEEKYGEDGKENTDTPAAPHSDKKDPSESENENPSQ